MSLRHTLAVIAVSLAAIGGATAQVVTHAPAPTVPDYAVFVDPPTGFVFMRMPAGWKFVGRIDEAALAQLPGHVVTSLLPPDDDEPRVAGRPAAPLR